MARTISKLAKILAVNVETIRFYERKGLIQQPLKPSIGYRHYPDKTLNRIRFIKRSQELGFTLNEISSLLEVNDNPCHVVQELAAKKLSTIQHKLKHLKGLETALKDLLIQCDKNDDESICPIIDVLQPD